MSINLKHFGRYRSALKTYARAINISLRYDPKADDDGFYSPRGHTIKIDSNMSDSDMIGATLHELGHALDDAINWSEDKKLMARISSAYLRTYSKQRTSRKQSQLVLKCEKAAWQYGRAIAKKLNIKLGKWYDSYMIDCLKSYRGRG